MFTAATVFSALELGFIYALVAMALFLSFRILNIADMSTDGTFTLGCAVSATAAVAGHPVLGLFLAIAAGAASGFVTATLQTRLGVPSILAGIITNTGLYTVNLAVMGFSSNVPMLKTQTIFTMAQALFGDVFPYKLLVAAVITVVVCLLLILFLGTRMGLSIRATGDNPDMVRASSINTAFTITDWPVHFQRHDVPFRRRTGPVPEIRRHQPGHRHGGHRPGVPHHRRDAVWPWRHVGQGRGGCGRQCHLPLHHRAGPARQRPVGVSQADFRRHRGAGHRRPHHPVTARRSVAAAPKPRKKVPAVLELNKHQQNL